MPIDFNLSTSEAQTQAAAARFAQDVLAGARSTYMAYSSHSERFEATRPTYEGAVAAGLIKGQLSPSIGGTAGSLVEAAILVEEFYAVEPSASLTIFATGLGLTPFNLVQDSSKNDFLAPFLSGMGAPLSVHHKPSDSADKMPPVVQALYQSTDLSATFDAVARSMTKWIRDTSNASSQVGVAQEWTIRIHVEWPYIAAPLAAFAAGLVFCIYSVFETRKLGLEPWKTNAIPTLTHSVDAETRAQLRHAYRQGYLDKAVRAMVVSYEDVGNGLELKIKQS
ncbi:hypothetical protein CIB48_g10238 [Xylaria polymorpha]|nr:hypothetical protein CIB48_g10238 [Xylaria polymorpha]